MASGQAPTALQQADSLFEQRRYVEGYALYDSMVQYGVSSAEESRILLRMAYIQEGIGNYPLALYHILCYHARSYSSVAWLHAVRLAQRMDVPGYVQGDGLYFGLFLLRNHLWGNVLLVGLLVGCVAWCWVRRRSVGALVSLMGLVGLFWVWQSFAIWLPRSGVILDQRAVLMEGPSPAAAVLATDLLPGTRVEVVSVTPTWVLVQYTAPSGRHVGYIKRPWIGVVSARAAS